MIFDIEKFFNGEVEEFQKTAKVSIKLLFFEHKLFNVWIQTEEEIKKYSTNEDFTELK